MRNQPTLQTYTLEADEIQNLKSARKQLWQVLATLIVMSKSEHDESIDYGVALEGVAELMSNAMTSLDNMRI